MMIDTVPIDSIIPDPSNVRKHSAKNLAAIKGSLARFGQQKPIVISSARVVIAGNGTLEAAKSLGWKEINVVRSELDGTDLTAFAIADNRTGELASWDDEALKSTLASLAEEDFDLNSIGFSEDDLNKLLKEAGHAEEAAEKNYKKIYEVVIECVSEEDQEKIYTELTDRGHKCRVLSM